MRRNEKEIIEKDELLQIIKGGKFATISMAKNNEPYLVTLTYGYDLIKDALYFHCAKEGLKMDFLKHNSRICGTIIEDGGYSDGCTQIFRSVVFRGNMVVVDEIEEKKYGFDVMINHLEVDKRVVKDKFLNNDSAYIKPAILRLDISHITGKEERADSN